MKRTKYFFVFLGLLAVNIAAQGQSKTGIDSTGLPGDHFSLQGALEMFKKAGSPEEFEKLINTEDNSVNNLDLNADGETDYIRVLDKAEQDAHAFVLQVAVSETENQDVAVIEVEKTGAANAVLQIIGDEDLYGESVIMEPDGGESDVSFVGEQLHTTAARGPSAPEFSFQSQRLVVNVWFWPSVTFIYGPVYRPWASPWRWRHYPGWYRPWRPVAWHVYQPRVRRYHRPFVVVHTHRLTRAHRVYAPHRVSSVSVRTRNSTALNNYRVTRTKTTVTGPRGASVTRKKTEVKKNRKVGARTSRNRRVR